MKTESEKDVLVQPTTQPRTELDRAQERQPRARIPFGVPRQRMTVIGEIPGYELSWINDVGGRIQEALLGGYEFVSPSEITLAVGNVVPTNKELGDRISLIAFKKTGEKAFLMKIRKEHKDENREILRQMRNQRLGSIVKGQTTAVDKNFYVPGHTPIKISKG